jgi:hypothetical protein
MFPAPTVRLCTLRICAAAPFTESQNSIKPVGYANAVFAGLPLTLAFRLTCCVVVAVPGAVKITFGTPVFTVNDTGVLVELAFAVSPE